MSIKKVGREVPTARTSHSCIYPPYVRQQRYFCELHSKGWGFKHLISHDFGTFGRIVEGVYIEIAKVDLGRWFTRSFICECQGLVVEDVVEKRILDVVAGEYL